jgi:hypothetical protein
MSTRSVVDEIKVVAKDWDEEGAVSVCSMLNKAQNFLFSKPCALSLYKDPDTGDYPFLTTLATQKDYEIPDFSRDIDGVARTLRIFAVYEVFSVAASASEYTDVLRNRSGSRFNVNDIVYRGKGSPALQNTRARWMFKEDPGASSDRYQYKGLIEPLQITAVSIPLMVPQDCEDVLVEGALGYIEKLEYGKSDRLTVFQNQLANDFWTKQGSYADDEHVDQVPIREA